MRKLCAKWVQCLLTMKKKRPEDVSIECLARGINLTDYLREGKTINSKYQTNLLQRFSDEIRKKRPHLEKKSVVS